MLGFAPGELPRDSHLCEHLVHSEDAPALHGRWPRTCKVNTSGSNAIFACARRDERWCWLSARGQLVARDRDGNPLRVTGTAQDVTQRRRGDALDQMLAAVLDSSDDLIVSRTLDGTVLVLEPGRRARAGLARRRGRR